MPQRESVEALINHRIAMNRKHLILAAVVGLAAGGLWFARSDRHTRAFDNTSAGAGVGLEAPQGPPTPGQEIRPPDPTRRFTDFTPEQRVEFARKGHGPGG